MPKGKTPRNNEEKARIKMKTKVNKTKAWDKHIKTHPNDKQAPALIKKKQEGMNGKA